MSAAVGLLTSPVETRVRGFRHCPSGRSSRRARLCSINAPGSRACAYKTASGRRKWINQDPIGEAGGGNLYGYVENNPINAIDPLGLIGTPAENISLVLALGEEEAAETIGPAAARAAAAAIAAGALTSGGDRCETRQYGKGERGQARKNPSDAKADADKEAGRDRGTGKLDRPPQQKPEPPKPDDPLRGKFPKRPPGDNMPPKDGGPAPVRGGR